MALRAGTPPRRISPSRRPRLGGWSRSQWQATIVMLMVGGGLAYGYWLYSRSGGDISPDSLYGYIFAITGTILLSLVGIGYVLRKRLRKGAFKLLHTALAWHVVGGILALALIFAHSAGNFNPRSGTYALYALIALVISGIIGRQLDRLAPRLAARAALKTVTANGDERLDTLVRSLDMKRLGQHERHEPRGRHAAHRSASASPASSSGTWDLAYYDLSATADDIPVLLKQPRRDGARRASAAALASEAQEIRQAIGIEQLCLHLIRVWRYLHTMLSIVTLGLILWHLEFAATLLLNAR
ncbi:MAG TPA: hypothetical protein VF040_06885 [Ktedonobacterales bacterium]